MSDNHKETVANILSFFRAEPELRAIFSNIFHGFLGIPLIFTLLLLINIWNNNTFLNEELDLYTLSLINIIFSIILWFLFRRVKKFKENEIGILISLTKPDTEARIKVNKELRLICNSLQGLVKREKINNTVKINVLPDRLSPNDENSAHILRERYHSNLIIWGDMDYGNIDNKKHTTFSNVCFSFGLPLTQENTDKFSKNLSQILKKSKWVIRESEDLSDRDYLVKNIEKFSLYILGFAYLRKDQEIAIYFLKNSLIKFKEYSSDQDGSVAVENIKIAIWSIVGPKINQLELWPSSKDVNTEINKSEILISELENIGFLPDANNLKAVVCVAKGDYPSARKSLGQIPPDILNKNVNMIFNYSYIYYAEGNVIEGTKYLLKAMKSNFFTLSPQSPNLARWYQDHLQNNPSKIYLNFPLGIIYFDLMRDHSLAKKCLEIALNYSIEKYNENKVWKYVKYQVEKRLKKIKV